MITSISSDSMRVNFRFPNGNSGFMTSENDVALHPGEVILISGNEFRVADPSMWIEEKKIGVIRKIINKQLLIEDGYSFHLIPNKKPKETVVGQTVTYDESGVHEVIADTPLHPRDVNSTDMKPDRYLWKSQGKKLTFDDFGGYPDVIARARELIETPLLRAEELASIRAKPIKGVLFTGPPGTGKTHLARIIADQSKAAFYSISGPEIVSKWVGDSEGNLRTLFEDAAAKPRAVVFFDEIDSLAEKRSGESHESSKRVVAQLLTLMDGFEEKSSNIIVIAATNRPDDIDPALRRPGRFDWEIEFPMPTANDRLQILKVSMKRLNVVDPSSMPLETIAERTDGWSAARIASIWTEAALLAATDRRGSLRVEDLAGAFERLRNRSQSSNGGI
ncbi:hypothetical protein AN948_28275 [Rhodococcus sp. ADH]|nr:hypothetical protein AN948_28275 [Rhodococcus sp. ADH]